MNMTNTTRFLIGCMIVSLHAVAQTPAPANSQFQLSAMSVTGKPVAKVNGTVLTDRDLLHEMMIIFPYARQHGGKFPQTMEADIRRGALSMLEFEELVYQEAERRRVNVPSARLDKAMLDFQDQFTSPDEFHSYLKDECGGSLRTLRDKVRRSILISDFLGAEVNRKVVITDAQIREYYRKNSARFFSAESVSIQTISIAIPDKPTSKQEADSRKRAEDALTQARKTKSYEEFGLLAEKVSEDDWRVMMGDHQFVTREQMPPEVAKIAFALKNGQTSDLIRAENSFCVVRLNARQDAHQVSYDQVKASLKKELEGTKVDALRQALHQQLRKNARVEEL
jgi:parvulin-like peptidyl-prolyl isomerase